MVQQRTYHEDRPATPAERMRALRARKRNGVEASVTPKRNGLGASVTSASVTSASVTSPSVTLPPTRKVASIRPPGGRPASFTRQGGRVRTTIGHDLVLLIGARFSDERLEEIRTRPPYNNWKPAQLRDAYFRARKASPPPTEPRDQLISRLEKLGSTPDGTRILVDRLITIVTVRLPYLGLAYIAQMFDHVARVRRLRTGQSRIKWLERAADKLESDRPSYPIRPWDRASDTSIDLIKAALRKGLTGIGEISAHTGLKRRTAQELLVFMSSNGNGEAVRLRHGHYGPPREGAIASEPPGKVILRVLKDGPATSARIRDRGDLTKAQSAGALHWLWKRAGKIVRLRPDLYALPGTAPVPHTYARDAIIMALRSGKKSVPELIAVTQKNRGEIWAALRRLCANGIVRQIGFRNGHAVRPGFRGRVAVFALTAKGQRLAQGRQ
jgi:hypothetical protein